MGIPSFLSRSLVTVQDVWLPIERKVAPMKVGDRVRLYDGTESDILEIRRVTVGDNLEVWLKVHSFGPPRWVIAHSVEVLS